MALTPPNGRSVFLPQVPEELKSEPVGQYLEDLRKALEATLIQHWDNMYYTVDTGTTGSFVISAGTTVTVESGIITELTP